MSFEITKATRQGIIPLIGLWGGTGSGKTRSALMLARGMAGKAGRLGVVDTEGKRSCYYSDSIEGGFDVINFDPPFTPERYVEAVDMLEQNSDVGVIDSASHAWFGPDGVLDMHEAVLDKMTKGSTDWRERERLNWPAWREPKVRFKKLINRILQFKKPLIVCFRGETKTRMVKDGGRNTVQTDENTSPVFDTKTIFEFHVAMELFQKDGIGGYIRFPMPYAKTSHRDLRRCFPESEKGQLNYKCGEDVIAWCNSAGSPVAPTPTAPAKKSRNDLLKELRDVTASEHGWRPEHGPAAWQVAKTVLQTWITDELGIETMIEHQTDEQLVETIKKADDKIRSKQEVGLQ